MAVAPQADAAVGAILNGQWKLQRLIGEGGLAAVYAAEDLQGGGQRAVKLLHAQFQAQPEIVERFYAEAKACFSLKHPHIASVEGYAYAEDGSPYIVMELLRGMSIEEYLRSRDPMDPQQGAPILHGILQALDAAHEAGIVHRDLKPANLFLVPNPDGTYMVKALDFGIAKVIDLAGGLGTKTRTGAVLGTPGYMSPEQIKNAKAVDLRSDLWAAGVVFFEMLSGKHPYGEVDHFARMVAVLRDDPIPILKVAPQLGAWSAFFDKAMQRDPDNRFQSAKEMAGTLRQVAQGTPARLVSDGIQTVAMPMMPDLVERYSHAPAVSAAAPAGPTGVSVGVSAQSQVEPLRTSMMPQMSPATGAYGAAASGHPPAPPAGAHPTSNTQVSGASHNAPRYFSQPPPNIHVMSARDEEPPSLVWWGAVLLGLSCFAVGILLGYVLAS